MPLTASSSSPGATAGSLAGPTAGALPVPGTCPPAWPAARAIVIDTNVVLDLLLFQDPHTPQLARAIAQGQLRWLATPRMREECQRVLAYPHLQKVAQQKGVSADAVLAQFDTLSHPVPAAPAASPRCRDRDDQCFIDLAVAHGATLISKDRHVLKLRKKLRDLGVPVLAQWVDVLS